MARARVPVLAALLLAACAAAASRSPDPPTTAATRPALVVLIAIDQLRGDYIPRWQHQLTGGLGRFWREGAFFSEGRQDHALTETAPGHASMLSGRHPGATGIVTNLLGVSDSESPLLELKDAGFGASPRRFRGTTLYDWLRKAHPGGSRSGDGGPRVLAVSRKDRGAILPVGRSRGDVYWYAGGIFTTSRWYRETDTLPGWVREFNAALPVNQVAGWEWTLLLPDSAYAERDSLPTEAGGRDFVFPHQLTPNIDAAAIQLVQYPVMDSLTLAFTLRGVERTELGRRGVTDLLVISLSTTDAVGHLYGPDSRELHDQVLRVDRMLGSFLDSLWKLVPRDRMVLALTGDHGMVSMPEYTTGVLGRAAGRVWLGDVARELDETVGRAARAREPFGFDFGVLYGDVARLRSAGVNVDSLATALAARVAAREGIARVFTPATLRRAPADDADAALWRRSLPDDLGWLLAAVLKPDYVWSPGRSIAEHGSTHVPNQHVPIAFLGPGIAARQWSDTVSITDLAPTLAALAGVKPTQRLDGRVLTQVLRTAAR